MTFPKAVKNPDIAQGPQQLLFHIYSLTAIYFILILVTILQPCQEELLNQMVS